MMLLSTGRVSLSLCMVLPLTLRDKKGLISMQNPYVELTGVSDSRITRQDLILNWILEEKVLIFLVHFVIFKFPFKTELILLLSFNVHLV